MKKLIVANWKMNPQTLDEAKKLAASWEHRMSTVTDQSEVVIAAPFVFLPSLMHQFHHLKLAAQNASWQEAGALTGEISVKQLLNWKVEYVILGHSERRIYLGETDSMVQAKIVQVLAHQLTPILCLGGDSQATQDGMETLVTQQFIACTKDLTEKQLAKLVYAYEPTWAISTMKNSAPASGEHAAELIEHIYMLLEHRLGKAARSVRVIYGGTVNKDNVHEYAKFPIIDGALVGGASLVSENFWAIIKEFARESIHK